MSSSRCTRAVLSRREMLETSAGLAAWAMLGPAAKIALGEESRDRLHQSVCAWCYIGYCKQAKRSLDEFAGEVAALGLESIELTNVNQWPTLKKHGLICAMANSHTIVKGLNHVENREECLAAVRRGIDDCAAAGFPNVICFSGNAEGMGQEEGMKNCEAALKSIVGYAEEKKVTICMEQLNSIDHPDYMAATTQWTVELTKRVGSPRFKILYDIYHAAMMGEDPVADIKNHHECFGHYHTAGYPGRHDIDETQKLDYRAIFQAIVDTKFTGYVGHEFMPKNCETLASLEYAVKLCRG